jgi:hypothetical protein
MIRAIGTGLGWEARNFSTRIVLEAAGTWVTGAA